MTFVVKGWRLHSPYQQIARSLDQAVDIAFWARSQNFWAPRTVEEDGEVILDEAALDKALQEFDPWRGDEG